MPEWVADHDKWNRAKEKARQQYPDVDEDSDRFYQIVTTIYKRMGGKTTKKSNE